MENKTVEANKMLTDKGINISLDKAAEPYDS